MSISKRPQGILPKTFSSLEDLVEFWDTHDTEDYPEAWREVEFRVTTRERRYPRITLEPQILAQLENRARAMDVSLNALVNRMLKESLAHNSR